MYARDLRGFFVFIFFGDRYKCSLYLHRPLNYARAHIHVTIYTTSIYMYRRRHIHEVTKNIQQRIYVLFAQAKYKVNVIVQIQAHNRVRIYDKHRH